MSSIGYRAIAAGLLFATTGGLGAQSGPDLRFNAPASFYKSASTNPEDYNSGQVNAGMQVYPFRPFSGDIAQQFQRTLLREWVDPRYQEGNVAAPPQFSRVNLVGAQATFVARFVENVAGTMKEHMRVVIVAGGLASVVDLSANSATSWRVAAPTMLASLNSMAVVQGGAAGMTQVSAATGQRDAAPAGSGDASFAGLYMAMKQRFISGIYGIPGTSRYVTALHYYMLAPDGRAYRVWDSAGDVRSFDYATAQRNDPENSGRWMRRGNQVVLQVGGEQLIGAISADGGFKLSGVGYAKQD